MEQVELIKELMNVAGTELDQEVERTLEIARKEFPHRDFPTPDIKMDLTGKSAGIYYPKENKIRFNFDLMMQNKKDFISNTVPHEIAHLVVHIIAPGSKAHGRAWQAIMGLFGVTPQTYHDYKVAPVKRQATPYIYECSCQRHHLTKNRHNRAKRGVIYFCKHCHKDLHYVGTEN